MDGRNSSGRKISLLNDSAGGDRDRAGDVAGHASGRPLLFKASRHSHTTLPPLSAPVYHHPPPPHPHSLHSRVSSCTSTPSLSPPTPQLIRSTSSDSRVFGSPSPATPLSASFQDHHQHQPHHRVPQQHYFVHPRYAKMDDPALAMYQPLDHNGMVMPVLYQIPAVMQQPLPQPPQQLYRTSTSPSSEPSRVSTVSASSTGAKSSGPKKNQYPCPMAKAYNCTDYFTTSGHAARHAKKHTGKKDAFCPECNKAFTRKDNMEQHRRTHQSGRTGGRTSGTEDAKVKKSVKPASKKIIKSEPVQAAIDNQIEQNLAGLPQDQTLNIQVQQTLAPQPEVIMAAPPLPATMIMPTLPQEQIPITADTSMLIPPVGVSAPYYLTGVDTGPIPPLPMPTMADTMMRPPLYRSNFTSSLDYMPPLQMSLGDQTDINFSYPSPGLSNGLHNLAIVASEAQRNPESQDRSPRSCDASPTGETPCDESP